MCSTREGGARSVLNIAHLSGPGEFARRQAFRRHPTFQGKFIELVRTRRSLNSLSSNRAPRDSLARWRDHTLDRYGETEVTVRCENLPTGIRPEDDELGCRLSAAESGQAGRIAELITLCTVRTLVVFLSKRRAVRSRRGDLLSFRIDFGTGLNALVLNQEVIEGLERCTPS